MIRKARIEDAEKIHSLVNFYASQNLMLPLSLSEIYDSLRDFFVYADGDEVSACCALRIVWKDLAEIRSLAVGESTRGRGIGCQLVQTCLEEARRLGLKRIFVLTFIPHYFERFGFRVVNKDTLPHKVWSDCIKCPKFPDCDEEAMLVELSDG